MSDLSYLSFINYIKFNINPLNKENLVKFINSNKCEESNINSIYFGESYPESLEIICTDNDIHTYIKQELNNKYNLYKHEFNNSK